MSAWAGSLECRPSPPCCHTEHRDHPDVPEATCGSRVPYHSLDMAGLALQVRDFSSIQIPRQTLTQ